MSMYNMIHGVNPMAGLLLTALGLEPRQIPRLRDCYWNGEHICIYTRTGGGNREHYDEPNDDNVEGPWNSSLRAVSGFSHDSDDDFDSTYATFYFTPAPALKEALTHVPAADATPEQKWQSFFERLHSGADDPQVARVTEAMKPIIEKLTQAIGEA